MQGTLQDESDAAFPTGQQSRKMYLWDHVGLCSFALLAASYTDAMFRLKVKCTCALPNIMGPLLGSP